MYSILPRRKRYILKSAAKIHLTSDGWQNENDDVEGNAVYRRV